MILCNTINTETSSAVSNKALSKHIPKMIKISKIFHKKTYIDHFTPNFKIQILRVINTFVTRKTI